MASIIRLDSRENKSNCLDMSAETTRRPFCTIVRPRCVLGWLTICLASACGSAENGTSSQGGSGAWSNVGGSNGLGNSGPGGAVAGANEVPTPTGAKAPTLHMTQSRMFAMGNLGYTFVDWAHPMEDGSVLVGGVQYPTWLRFFGPSDGPVASIESTPGGSLFVGKLNPTLDLEWITGFGYNSQSLIDPVVLADGSVAVVSDVDVRRIGTNGEQVWSQRGLPNVRAISLNSRDSIQVAGLYRDGDDLDPTTTSYLVSGTGVYFATLDKDSGAPQSIRTAAEVKWHNIVRMAVTESDDTILTAEDASTGVLSIVIVPAATGTTAAPSSITQIPGFDEGWGYVEGKLLGCVWNAMGSQIFEFDVATQTVQITDRLLGVIFSDCVPHRRLLLSWGTWDINGATDEFAAVMTTNGTPVWYWDNVSPVNAVAALPDGSYLTVVQTVLQAGASMAPNGWVGEQFVATEQSSYWALLRLRLD